jgi:hypothetical protein
MNRLVEIGSGLPRWTIATGAGGLVLTVLLVAALAGGEDGSLATGGSTSAGLGEPPVILQPTSAPAAQHAPLPTSTSSSTSTTTTAPPTTVNIDDEYDADRVDAAGVVARPIPNKQPAAPPPPTAAPPPWAESTRSTAGGLATDVGCAENVNAAGLDAFFADRVGPVLGWDYQHVVPLGGGRHLWLFQDTFIDHTGGAARLDQASFVHNAALVQDGRCFTLLHAGTAAAPDEFEPGDGTGDTLSKWFWPMGGDSDGTTAWVFWAEMVKDPIDPAPPDGLGWHPERTWVATYDAATLERLDFRPAPNDGAAPIYGYAVESDSTYSYLFGNTFEQNLTREGGFWNMPHSGSRIWLARVPLHAFQSAPEYRTRDGWSMDPADAVPVVERFNVENPMQPRLLDGQWVSATKVDGYWGSLFVIDVAEHPWGPWHPVDLAPLLPRRGDPLMNTYHAHVLPWRDGFGSVQIAVSNNARDMPRDAYGDPWRYRPAVFHRPYVDTPTPTTTQPPPPPTPTTTTVAPTTEPPTTVTDTTTTTTTVPPTTTTSTTTTTVPPTTPTTTAPPTTAPPTTPTTTSTTPPTSAPPPPTSPAPTSAP